MSTAVIKTFAGQGVTASEILVEVHLANGLPGFQLVGMAETSVKEARERVRSALVNSGFEFPAKRITVNLAPADIPKYGGRFDLPIAVGIMVAAGYINDSRLQNHSFIGELSLNGEIRPITGIVPVLMAAAHQDSALVFPGQNDVEASIVSNAKRLPCFDLTSIYHHLSGEQPLKTGRPMPQNTADENHHQWDDIIGQHQAKRAMTIAAAGAHNLLMVGPPGTGKSLLAGRMLSLLPNISEKDALEVASLHSIKGLPVQHDRFFRPPFRSPHHTSSAVSLTGGGSHPAPGEISLAHNGVLFLDELPEFGRKALDVLREPLETGDVNIARAASHVCYPAKFQLVAAMNPSPTGDIDDNRMSPQQQLNYLNRLSGPFLDRIDIQVEVPKLKEFELSHGTTSSKDSFESARLQVNTARQLQLDRQGKVNALLSPNELAHFCNPTSKDLAFLQSAAKHLNLSMRVFHRTLKVARTLADMAQEPRVNQVHMAEALGYRALDNLIRQLTAS